MSENEKPKTSSNVPPKPTMPKKAPVPQRPNATASSRPPVRPIARPVVRPAAKPAEKPVSGITKPNPTSKAPVSQEKSKANLETKTAPKAKSSQTLTKPKVGKVDTKNVEVKDTKGDENKEEKKKKRRKLLLLLLLLLIFFVAISVAIYFIANVQREELNFTIDMRYVVQNEEVDPVTGERQKLKLLPGQSLDATLLIQIRNQDLIKSPNKKVFLRFKVDIDVDDNSYIGLFDPQLKESEKWFRGNDGYYYYNYIIFGTEQRMTAFEKLDFVADRANNVLNGKTGNLTFTVEILEGNFAAISQHWSTAPTRWRQTVN